MDMEELNIKIEINGIPAELISEKNPKPQGPKEAKRAEIAPYYIKGRGVYVPVIEKVIAMQDLEGGKDLPWSKAKGVAASQEDWYVILYWKEKINALLLEHGGKPIEGWHWTGTKSQYNATNAWLVNMYSGGVTTYNKTTTYRVRPVSAL